MLIVLQLYLIVLASYCTIHRINCLIIVIVNFKLFKKLINCWPWQFQSINFWASLMMGAGSNTSDAYHLLFPADASCFLLSLSAETYHTSGANTVTIICMRSRTPRWSSDLLYTQRHQPFQSWFQNNSSGWYIHRWLLYKSYHFTWPYAWSS